METSLNKKVQTEKYIGDARAILTVNGKVIVKNITTIAAAIAKRKNKILKETLYLEKNLGKKSPLLNTTSSILQNHIMSIIKANAYGLNANFVVPILKKTGILNWGIATLEEAIELQKILKKTEPNNKKHNIFLLGNALNAELPNLIRHKIIIGFASAAQLKLIAAIANKLKSTAKIQWLINTGMGRLGTPTEQQEEVFKILCELTKKKHITLIAAYSHFANGEIPNNRLTKKQCEIFTLWKNRLQKQFPNIIFHLAASFGIAYHTAIKQTLSRIGIALYGVGEYEKETATANWTPLHLPLQVAITLQAAIVSVRLLTRGCTIGYHATYKMPEDGYIATLAIGYADGVMTALKNCGEVLISGTRYPIVGKISMDYITVNLGNSATAKKIFTIFEKRTTYAILLGKSGKQEIKPQQWSLLADTNFHHVLTALGNASRLNKKFINA